MLQLRLTISFKIVIRSKYEMVFPITIRMRGNSIFEAMRKIISGTQATLGASLMGRWKIGGVCANAESLPPRRCTCTIFRVQAFCCNNTITECNKINTVYKNTRVGYVFSPEFLSVRLFENALWTRLRARDGYNRGEVVFRRVGLLLGSSPLRPRTRNRVRRRTRTL